MITPEPGSPRWEFPWQRTEISSFRDWNQVAKAIAPFYRTDIGDVHPTVKAVTQKIIRDAKAATPEERIQAIVHHVQNEIGYLGLESGVHGHRPTPPHDVLRRGFGDCKDKTTLACAMLQSIQVIAKPVLVSAHELHRVKDMLPSPQCFDHMILLVDLADRLCWVDLTQAYCGGKLGQQAREDFRFGLIVDSTTQSLSPIPHVRNFGSIDFTLRVERIVGEKFHLHIRQIAAGHTANRLRQLRRSVNNAEYQKGHADGIAGFTNCELVDFEEVEDLDRNRVTTSYRVIGRNELTRGTGRQRLQFEIPSLMLPLSHNFTAKDDRKAALLLADIDYKLRWEVPKHHLVGAVANRNECIGTHVKIHQAVEMTEKHATFVERFTSPEIVPAINANDAIADLRAIEKRPNLTVFVSDAKLTD